MKHFAVLASALFWTQLAMAEAPKRVVSANLCADQLLLELADPAQIVSLSPLSVSPGISYLSERAKTFPINRGHAEDIVMLGADLVLVSAFDSHYMRAMLQAKNLPSLVIEPWNNLEHGRQQIHNLANRLGHPERGAALIKRIDEALAHAKTQAPPRKSLHIERRGYVPGSIGLVNEVTTHMGLADMSAQAGLPHGGFMTLEKVLTLAPEFLVVSDITFGAEDQGQAFLIHPALTQKYPPEKRINVQSRLSICGGPSTPELIKTLSDQIRSKVR